MLDDIAAEVGRQRELWGESSHPNGTGPDTVPLYRACHILNDDSDAVELQKEFKHRTGYMLAHGKLTWTDILLEEVFEALSEDDEDKLKEELVQIAAVCVSWVKDINRRKDYDV